MSLHHVVLAILKTPARPSLSVNASVSLSWQALVLLPFELLPYSANLLSISANFISFSLPSAAANSC